MYTFNRYLREETVKEPFTLSIKKNSAKLYAEGALELYENIHIFIEHLKSSSEFRLGLNIIGRARERERERVIFLVRKVKCDIAEFLQNFFLFRKFVERIM